MEKDHFKDRPESIQYHKNLYKGLYVFICLKKMQPKAKEISDLTFTRVNALLTSQQIHPRGQKIKGDEIHMDKYGNKIMIDEYEEVVGRCTYIIDKEGWSFDTKEGKKLLVYNYKEDKLDVLPYGKLKRYAKLFLMLKAGKALIRVPLYRFAYFSGAEDAGNFLKKIDITEALFNGKILFKINGQDFYEEGYRSFIDGKEIDEDSLHSYFSIGCRGAIPMEIESINLERLV